MTPPDRPDTDPPVEGAPAPDETAARAQANDKPPRKSGRGGKRPGAGRPPKAQTVKARTTAIEAALSDLLSVPAVPCAMLGHEWPAAHFSTAGPAFAKNLAEMSETNPGLRAVLERAMTGGTYAALCIGAFGYAVPPAVYFLAAPDSPLRPMLRVPVPPQYDTPPPAGENGHHATSAAQSPPAGESRPA